MRALTLWQPWAGQVFNTVSRKDIENRNTLLPLKELLEPVDDERPFFAIHAGLKYDPSPRMHYEGTATGGWAYPKGVIAPLRSGCVFGAILGVVRVKHVLDARARKHAGEVLGGDAGPFGELDGQGMRLAPWWLGPIGWRLVDAIPVEPVPCKGALGCWKVPPDLAEQVRARARAAIHAELDGRAYVDAPNGSPHTGRSMPWMDAHDLAKALRLFQ